MYKKLNFANLIENFKLTIMQADRKVVDRKWRSYENKKTTDLRIHRELQQ